ncbi:MAG: hypothetical protein OHK0022_35450 [Roseiflexaceae bacterium]
MSQRAEQLAATFEAICGELVAAVAGCTDAQWQRPSTAEGWPVNVLAHHVAEVQGAFNQILSRLATGETYTPGSSMERVHASNQQHAREYAGVGKAEVLDLLQANGAAGVELIRRLSDGQLDQAAGVYGGNPLSVGQVVEWIIIGHASEHLESLRATLVAD